MSNLTDSMHQKAVMCSRLRNTHLIPCLVLLTERELLWKVGISCFSGKTDRISLCEVVFVCSIERIRDDDSSLKMIKLLQKELEQQHSDISLPGFVVSSVVRIGKHRWKTHEDIFWCESSDTAQEWISVLRHFISTTYPSRPHRLLVFLNPNAGHKRAEQIYAKSVSPLFHLAGIQTDIVVTSRRGHVTEYLLTNSLDNFDGVICVGGDGFVSEAVQGVLLQERIKAKLPLYSFHLPGSIELPATKRIGIIPAGSTDTIVFSTHGTNDVLTAVLHIIVGDDLALDVAAVHASETGSFVRYVLSMVGYGFHADLLKNDDKLRWMGPRRYDCSGLSAFLSHLTYAGEISYLPSSNRDSHSRDGVLCAVGCSVCSSHTLCQSGNDSKGHLTVIREKTKRRLMNGVLPRSSGMMSKCRTDPQLLFSPLVQTHEWSEKPSAVQFYLGVPKSDTHVNSTEPEVEPTHVNVDPDFPASSDSHSRYFIERRQQKPSCRPESLYISMENGFDSSSNEASPISTRLATNRSTLHPSPSWSIQGCSKGWRTVTGCFVAINAFIQSCRCVKAMAGPSPWAHLGDGCLDLILVHNCSRRQFLQYLIRVANGSNQTSCQRSRPGNDSPFELPFVTVERVCAFKFRSMSSIPTVRSLDNMWDHSQLTSDSAELHERTHSFSNTDRKPTSKLLHKASSNKKLPDSIWCADGELVHHTNVAVFVHRQLLRLYARGPEPLFQDALLGPTLNTDTQSGELFDAVAAAFARTDRLDDPAVVAQFDSN